METNQAPATPDCTATQFSPDQQGAIREIRLQFEQLEALVTGVRLAIQEECDASITTALLALAENIVSDTQSINRLDPPDLDGQEGAS